MRRVRTRDFTVLDPFADPEGDGFEMRNKTFGNLFGSKVVRNDSKVVSCAPREQWKDYHKNYKSKMGKCAHKTDVDIKVCQYQF